MTKSLLESQQDIFVGIDKILKFMWKDKGSNRIAKIILKKEEKVGRTTLHDFKAYYVTKIIMTMLLVDRPVGHWDRLETQKWLHISKASLFLVEVQKKMEEGYGLYSRWCWHNGVYIDSQMNCNLNLIHYTKINSK